MGSCLASETITISVILSESSGHKAKIVECPVVAAGTLLDLHTDITTFLGSHDILTAILFRGIKTQLTSPLKSFSAGGSIAPHFVASYDQAFSAEIKTPTGQQLHQVFRCSAVLMPLHQAPSSSCIDHWTLCRADTTVYDAGEQVKAALGTDPLRDHRLFIAQGMSLAANGLQLSDSTVGRALIMLMPLATAA